MAGDTSRWKIEDGNPLVMGAVPVPGGVNFSARVPKDTKAELVFLDGKGGEVLRVDLTGRKRVGECVALRVLGQGVRRCGYYYSMNGEITPDFYAKRIEGRTCYVEETFDGKDQPLTQNLEDMIIYRLHVRGFTKDPKSGVREKGTFRGLVRKIPYIKNLGFTAVELLPAYEWDEALREPPLLPNGHIPHPPLREGRRNYWGYAKKNYYLAPKQEFSYTSNAVAEVKGMVRELHKAGLACIMEFYAPKGTDPAQYLAGLRHWRLFYHVDGFHLSGEGVPRDLVLADPILTDAKLFLERVDLNSWRPERTLANYSTDWMYSMRSFLKSDEGKFNEVMQGLTANGSWASQVNYMTTTEGFTLRDLVSYTKKHNEANGDNNFDGQEENVSWNCGAEGETKDPEVLALRKHQMKNALAYVFLSQGVPLLCAGDEFGNSQQGNNFAYAQDSPIGWVNWGEAKSHTELTEYVRWLAAFRKEHPVLHSDKPLRSADYLGCGFPDLSFHSNHVWYVPFDPGCRSVGMLLSGSYAVKRDGSRDDDIFVALNAHWEGHLFEIPEPSLDREWVRVLDTAPELAEGTYETDEDGAMADQRHAPVPARSVTVLATRLCTEEKIRKKRQAIEARQEAERRRVRERIEQGRREEAMAKRHEAARLKLKADAAEQAVAAAEEAAKTAEERVQEAKRLEAQALELLKAMNGEQRKGKADG